MAHSGLRSKNSQRGDTFRTPGGGFFKCHQRQFLSSKCTKNALAAVVPPTPHWGAHSCVWEGACGREGREAKRDGKRTEVRGGAGKGKGGGSVMLSVRIDDQVV